jgi:hypothetical protein
MGLRVRVQSTSMGMPGGSACEGVCIAAGVAVVGACEQRNENGMCGGAGYVIGVGAGGHLEARWKASFVRQLRSRH